MDEWALPVAALPSAMRALQRLLGEGGGAHAAHFPVEVRFSAADDLPLSPAHGRATAWLGIIAYKPYGVDLGAHAPYFAAYERIMVALRGRPHWAKAFGPTPLRALYPQWAGFCALRERLDPGGLFLNGWARRVLRDAEGAPPAAWPEELRGEEAWEGAAGGAEGGWAPLEAHRMEAGVPPAPWREWGAGS